MQYSKQELRKLAKEKLTQLSELEQNKKNQNVSENLREFFDKNLTIHNKFIFGVYAPLKNEANILGIFKEANYRTAFPGIDNLGNMAFFESKIEDLEKTEEFGVIIETPRDKKIAVVPDVVLIPGLGFTKNGVRLGRGKGFFDKYLNNFDGMKIGICFQELIFESLPTERHDQEMDYVVTDGMIYRR